MITSFATVRTMMSICDIFMRTLCVGTTTNYTPKNRGMGFALCLCNTKAKPAINRTVNKNLQVNYMRTRKVVVLPYDVAWQSAFEKIKGEIEEAIDDLIIGIEHVGSTSVEGLSAKPCIDIDVIIKDYSVFTAVIEALKGIGYIHEGDLGIKDREAFKYTGKPHLMMHHLYVCPQYSEELNRHITFRDFLRINPEAVKKYSSIKEKAAELFPNDIDGYIEYKSPCIQELYKECGLK